MPKSDSLLSGKRCLVLDDEFLIALDIQQILERAGASHVTSVASAAEATELLGRVMVKMTAGENALQPSIGESVWLGWNPDAPVVVQAS